MASSDKQSPFTCEHDGSQEFHVRLPERKRGRTFLVCATCQCVYDATGTLWLFDPWCALIQADGEASDA